MSAETVQAYIQWYQQSQAINSQAAGQLNSITSQLNGLDPNNPNAPSQLSSLQSQAQSVVNSRESQLSALGPVPNPKSLTESELAQVGNVLGPNAADPLLAYNAALGQLQSAGASATQNISSAKSANTGTGQANPVTTTANGNTAVNTNPGQVSTDKTGNVSEPSVIASTNDIVINTEPLTVPIVDIKTGKVTSNVTIQPGPITIPGEKILSNGAVVPNTGTTAPAGGPPVVGLTAGIKTAAGAATAQDQANFTARSDWRVRLALAPQSNYLYNDPNPGILAPLSKATGTDGVIFPYTPQINVTYAANYDPTTLVHSNYKIFQYNSSSIDSVTISCEFTAQDVFEANYLLAVIHFFRSMTKMFYGKDTDPKNGTPPPLCYLYGLGGFQFDALPLAVTGFNYSLPSDVDYIKTTGASPAGTTQPSVTKTASSKTSSQARLGTQATPGGKAPGPSYPTSPQAADNPATYVPTKIQISITCLPIMSRNQVSNNFSLKDYASGELLRGTKSTRKGGGFW